MVDRQVPEKINLLNLVLERRKYLVIRREKHQNKLVDVLVGKKQVVNIGIVGPHIEYEFVVLSAELGGFPRLYDIKSRHFIIYKPFVYIFFQDKKVIMGMRVLLCTNIARWRVDCHK